MAKRLGLAHLDSDAYIESALGTTLQDIMDQAGREGFMRLEESLLLDMDQAFCVLSTGGSVVYSEAVMSKLSALGPVVFLRAGLELIRERIGRADNRGLVLPPGYDLLSLYDEREPLYMHYADVVVEVDGLDPEECADLVLMGLGKH